MKKEITTLNNDLANIDDIYKDIKDKIILARGKMLKHIDTTMVETYWYIGKITYEVSGNSTKATYGKQIIEELSRRLTRVFGNGYSMASISRTRKFYALYPILAAVPQELGWSHLKELIRVDRKEEREFYETEAIMSNWGYRELARQII